MNNRNLNLDVYENKKVKIVDIDGDTFIGKVTLYTQPNDNDGQEAVALDTGWWFDESDIKSIEVVE